MNYKLTIDVKQRVEDLYPNLSHDEIELIARHIVNRWDCISHNVIKEQVKETAFYANIELKDR